MEWNKVQIILQIYVSDLVSENISSLLQTARSILHQLIKVTQRWSIMHNNLYHKNIFVKSHLFSTIENYANIIQFNNRIKFKTHWKRWKSFCWRSIFKRLSKCYILNPHGWSWNTTSITCCSGYDNIELIYMYFFISA